MQEELEERIRGQEVWTFKECVGLAAEYNLKTRFVIAMVLATGKDYVDVEPGDRPGKNR